MLELDDIQSGVLRPRPTPYVATYIALRIDDRQAGRELMQRISNAVTSAAQSRESTGRYLGKCGVDLPGPEGAGRAARVTR